MKRSLFILVFSIIAPLSLQAQFSVGLNGTYHTFFGDQSNFPTGDVATFPEMIGGELRGMYGLGYKSAIKLGLMYRTNGENPYMYDTPATATDIGADFKAYYYLLGNYNVSNAGLYAFAGASGHMFSFKWNQDYVTERVPLSDQVYFEDLNVLRVHANLGLGAEVAVGPVYLFGEGQVALLMNHYVNGTTIKAIPQRDFWSVSFGFRVPFGAMSEPW